uniref:Tyr recombinase domain-containing protein n=1 Tax=Halimeda micronesica TaxID=170426 RepID=A0A386AXE1_9CHLO|nr:hypothetical protein [Halimeda micronesica]
MKGNLFYDSQSEQDIYNLLHSQGIYLNNHQDNSLNFQYEHLFLFSSIQSQGQKPLSRTFFTHQSSASLSNTILKNVPEFQEQYFTSHSFRKGYITKLWLINAKRARYRICKTSYRTYLYWNYCFCIFTLYFSIKR